MHNNLDFHQKQKEYSQQKQPVLQDHLGGYQRTTTMKQSFALKTSLRMKPLRRVKYPFSQRQKLADYMKSRPGSVPGPQEAGQDMELNSMVSDEMNEGTERSRERRPFDAGKDSVENLCLKTYLCFQRETVVLHHVLLRSWFCQSKQSKDFDSGVVANY